MAAPFGSTLARTIEVRWARTSCQVRVIVRGRRPGRRRRPPRLLPRDRVALAGSRGASSIDSQRRRLTAIALLGSATDWVAVAFWRNRDNRVRVGLRFYVFSA